MVKLEREKDDVNARQKIEAFGGDLSRGRGRLGRTARFMGRAMAMTAARLHLRAA